MSQTSPTQIPSSIESTLATMSTPTIVSTVPALQEFLSAITPSSTLFVSVKGTNLGRYGAIAIITILIYPQNTTYIIDMLALAQGLPVLFSDDEDDKTPTLKSILEDSALPNVFWDLRNDADALWALHNIKLSGVFNLQLMEVMSGADWQKRDSVRGLHYCISCDYPMGNDEMGSWLDNNSTVKLRMVGVLGDASGIGNVFSVRPVDEELVKYCVNDVEYLPRLREIYMRRLVSTNGSNAVTKVALESAKRLEEAWAAGYQPYGKGRMVSPWKTVKG